MARFTTYAEIVTPDHPAARAHAQGMTPNPAGRMLREYLELSGGEYIFRMPMDPRTRAKLLQVAAISNDDDLRRIADQSHVTISLEPFRNADPDKTRIVCGHKIEYTEAEGLQVAALDRHSRGQGRIVH